MSTCRRWRDGRERAERELGRGLIGVRPQPVSRGPYRARTMPRPLGHEGPITRDLPNALWGTDMPAVGRTIGQPAAVCVSVGPWDILCNGIQASE
jgi:hypothetical protein